MSGRKLSADDAEYMLRYLKITDGFCGTGRMGGTRISFGAALDQLKELNREFKGKIRPSTIRLHFPAGGARARGLRRTGSRQPEGEEVLDAFRSLLGPCGRVRSLTQHTKGTNVSKTMNVVEALSKIEKDAKTNQVRETRRVESMTPGQVVRQGDIYVHRVSDEHSRGARMKTKQLVRGVTTGSRHIAESPAKLFEGTKAPDWAARALVGPVIVSEKRFQVSHPEHARLDLPRGTYQVTLQMDARTNRAVQD